MNHSRTTGFHERGHSDYLEAGCSYQKLLWEELKLRRRLKRFCKAGGFIGNIRVFFRRRKLLARLCRRFEISQALFLSDSHGYGAVRDTSKSPY
jgi:hypothetical protein